MNIITYNKDIDNFIDFVRNDCKENKIEILFSLKSYVISEAENIKSNGFFCDVTKKLAVAIRMSQDKWLKTFVHEYSHMQQWLKNKKLWKNGSIGCEKSFDWLLGNIELKNPGKYLDMIKNLELDCEKRAVKNIKRFNLPLDVSMYIKSANCYVHFYNFMKQSRKWYKIGHEPYRNKNLIDLMPDNFDMDYSKIPKNSLKYFQQCI